MKIICLYLLLKCHENNKDERVEMYAARHDV